MSYKLVKESDIIIAGTCTKEFEPVRRQFYENFVQGKEENAQVCIYLGNQCVVDLWGSSKNDKHYGPDSFHVSIFKITKKRAFLIYNFHLISYCQ